MIEIKQVANSKMFGGMQQRYQHMSNTLQCEMHFSIFLPPQIRDRQVPVVYWLSGLTCTDENFIAKAGAQRVATTLGLALVAPDTSPRGADVPDDPSGDWDFGLGAGFYVNAIQEPWVTHYKMYDYAVYELPKIIASHFDVREDRQSIMGHSMGGHGALTIALKNPGLYRSASAFAPICAPTQCAWGEKAFSHYLGDNKTLWKEYDATELVKTACEEIPILVDQGDADDFLQQQLKPELLQQAAQSNDYPLTLRMQAGYDHSYSFIATFIEEHLNFHSKSLSHN